MNEKQKRLLEIFASMNEAGIERITASFSGGGDEGNIDGMTCLPKDKKISSDLESLVDAFVCEYTTWDWINNEGGGGTAVFDGLTNKCRITGYYNEMTEVDANPVEIKL